MYVIDVAKKHTNVSKRRSNKAEKRYRMVYLYDEDGSFHTKRVSFFKGLYYKTKKVKLGYCKTCKGRYIGEPCCVD